MSEVSFTVISFKQLMFKNGCTVTSLNKIMNSHKTVILGYYSTK